MDAAKNASKECWMEQLLAISPTYAPALNRNASPTSFASRAAALMHDRHGQTAPASPVEVVLDPPMHILNSTPSLTTASSPPSTPPASTTLAPPPQTPLLRRRRSYLLRPGPAVKPSASIPSSPALSPYTSSLPTPLAAFSALTRQTRRLLQSCYVSDPDGCVLAATADLAGLVAALDLARPGRSWWLAPCPGGRWWLVARTALGPLDAAGAPLAVTGRVDVTRLLGAGGAAHGFDDVWLDLAAEELRARHAHDPRRLGRVRDGACVWVAPGAAERLQAVRRAYAAAAVIVPAAGGVQVSHFSEVVAEGERRRFAAAVAEGGFEGLGRLLARRQRFFFDAAAGPGEGRRLACCVPLQDAQGAAAMWVCFWID